MRELRLQDNSSYDVSLVKLELFALLEELNIRTVQELQEPYSNSLFILPYDLQVTKQAIALSASKAALWSLKSNLSYHDLLADSKEIKGKLKTRNLVGFIGYKGLQVKITSRFAQELSPECLEPEPRQDSQQNEAAPEQRQEDQQDLAKQAAKHDAQHAARLDAQQEPVLQYEAQQDKAAPDGLAQASVSNQASLFTITDTSFSNHQHTRVAPDFLLYYLVEKVLNIHLTTDLAKATLNPSLDLFTYLFPYLLTAAVGQGIYPEYQTHYHNDQHPRSYIDVNRHLKVNNPFQGKIAYQTRELSYDNPVIELVRHTIEFLDNRAAYRQLLSLSDEVRYSVAQIRALTPSFRSENRAELIRLNRQKPCLHPYFTKYYPLQQLCLHLLQLEQFEFGTRSEKVQGVLFDVAKLWEEYLASLLCPVGFIHPDNQAKTEAIYLDAEQQLIRYPDFYHRDKGIVLDAKYKRELNQGKDVHQMIAYLYRLQVPHAVFILPGG